MNHPSGAEAFPSLSATEAAARRLERGDNILVPIKGSSALRELLSTLGDPMALMLVAVAVVDYALGETRDGVIMTIALIPVLGVDALLELRSRKALAALAGAVAPRARVVRDGAVTEVPASELVDGDLLILEEGDVIAADGAVLRAANLSIDEAMLTGESLPQEKYAAPDPGVAIAWARAGVGASEGPPAPIVPSSATTVIAGTIVLAGSGSARILATGVRTRFAGIARLVEATVDSPTPLQRRITRRSTGSTLPRYALAGRWRRTTPSTRSASTCHTFGLRPRGRATRASMPRGPSKESLSIARPIRPCGLLRCPWRRSSPAAECAFSASQAVARQDSPVTARRMNASSCCLDCSPFATRSVSRFPRR